MHDYLSARYERANRPVRLPAWQIALTIALCGLASVTAAHVLLTELARLAATQINGGTFCGAC